MRPTEPKAKARKATPPPPPPRKPGSNGARKPTDADMDALLEWIANGPEDAHTRSIVQGCRKFGLDRSEVHRMLATEEWSNKSARARELRGDEIGEMTFGLMDELRNGLDPAAARVMHDILKRASGAMAPKQWSEKQAVDVTSGGEKLPTTFVIGVSRVARIAQEGGGEDG